LNIALLNNHGVIEEGGNLKFSEANEIENTTYQNLFDNDESSSKREVYKCLHQKIIQSLYLQ
jgi:hypothetical protein